jgi:hypothetical protein
MTTTANFTILAEPLGSLQGSCRFAKASGTRIRGKCASFFNTFTHKSHERLRDSALKICNAIDIRGAAFDVIGET